MCARRERAFQTTLLPAKYKCDGECVCVCGASYTHMVTPCVGRMHRVAHKRSGAEGRATVTRKYGLPPELSLSFAFAFSFLLFCFLSLSLFSPPALSFRLFFFILFSFALFSSRLPRCPSMAHTHTHRRARARSLCYRLIHESRLFRQVNRSASRTIELSINGPIGLSYLGSIGLG